MVYEKAIGPYSSMEKAYQVHYNHRQGSSIVYNYSHFIKFDFDAIKHNLTQFILIF